MEKQSTYPKTSRRQFLKGAALVSVGALAAACQMPAPAVAPAAGGQAAAAPAQEVVTIEFITPGALGLERTMYENFTLKFMQANPNIQINVSFEAWGDYMTKLPTMLAGGVVPDMIHQHMSIVQDYAHRGALLDLVPYMERDNVKAEDYIPALFDAFSNRGSTYGIPKDSAAWGMYYNKDKFDAAGLAYPDTNWTLEDFRQMALALTLDKNGNPATSASFNPDEIAQWGFNWMEPTPTASETARGWVKAAGGDWYDDGYDTTLITSPEALEHFRMFHDMRCHQKSIPTSAQVQGQGDPFRAGLTAMAVSFHVMDFFSRQENIKFKYDVTFFPGGAGGQYSVVGCSGWAVPTGASHIEEGWELVKYLTNLSTQQFIGEQKRWGVSLKAAVDSIIPAGAPEHFAMVHTNPFHTEIPGIEVISFKFPPNQSRIRDIYASYFDPIWTCTDEDIDTAAVKTKEEVDEVLAELDW